MKKETLEYVRLFYIPDRLSEVDPDYLEYEEKMATEEEAEIILNKCYDLFGEPPAKELTSEYWENTYNSIILYITGLTNTFDFNEARSKMRGGSPPDCI